MFLLLSFKRLFVLLSFVHKRVLEFFLTSFACLEDFLLVDGSFLQSPGIIVPHPSSKPTRLGECKFYKWSINFTEHYAISKLHMLLLELFQILIGMVYEILANDLQVYQRHSRKFVLHEINGC